MRHRFVDDGECAHAGYFTPHHHHHHNQHDNQNKGAQETCTALPGGRHREIIRNHGDHFRGYSRRATATRRQLVKRTKTISSCLLYAQFFLCIILASAQADETKQGPGSSNNKTAHQSLEATSNRNSSQLARHLHHHTHHHHHHHTANCPHHHNSNRATLESHHHYQSSAINLGAASGDAEHNRLNLNSPSRPARDHNDQRRQEAHSTTLTSPLGGPCEGDCQAAVPLVAIMGHQQLSGLLAAKGQASAWRAMPASQPPVAHYAATRGLKPEPAQQQQRRRQQAYDEDYIEQTPLRVVHQPPAPPLKPLRDEKCPMTGPLTVCDQVDAYPADVILHKLESAKRMLKQTYFNIDSLFSDESEHSSEPFDGDESWRIVALNEAAPGLHGASHGWQDERHGAAISLPRAPATLAEKPLPQRAQINHHHNHYNPHQHQESSQLPPPPPTNGSTRQPAQLTQGTNIDLRPTPMGRGPDYSGQWEQARLSEGGLRREYNQRQSVQQLRVSQWQQRQQPASWDQATGLGSSHRLVHGMPSSHSHQPMNRRPNRAIDGRTTLRTDDFVDLVERRAVSISGSNNAAERDKTETQQNRVKASPMREPNLLGQTAHRYQSDLENLRPISISTNTTSSGGISGTTSTGRLLTLGHQYRQSGALTNYSYNAMNPTINLFNEPIEQSNYQSNDDDNNNNNNNNQAQREEEERGSELAASATNKSHQGVQPVSDLPWLHKRPLRRFDGRAKRPRRQASPSSTSTTDQDSSREPDGVSQPATDPESAANLGPESGGTDQFGQPEPVCRAKSIYISPKAALNDKKQWKYVVNAPERNPQVRQIIRVDICEDPFGPCSDQVTVPFGFTSQCKQKYSKKKLLALDSQSGLLEIDTFFIPSCCVCQLIRDSRLSAEDISGTDATSPLALSPSDDPRETSQPEDERNDGGSSSTSTGRGSSSSSSEAELEQPSG